MVLEIWVEKCSHLIQLVSGLPLFFYYFYLFGNKFFFKFSVIYPRPTLYWKVTHKNMANRFSIFICCILYKVKLFLSCLVFNSFIFNIACNGSFDERNSQGLACKIANQKSQNE